MILRNLFLALLVTHGESGQSIEKKVAKGIRNRSFDLMQALTKFDENIAISPLSIMGAMYMLAAGSAGESRAEIFEVLNFGSALDPANDPSAIYAPFEAYSKLINSLRTQPEKGYTLQIANAIFHQSGLGDYTPNSLEPKYMDVLKSHFIQNTSNIQAIDFHAGGSTKQATDLINRWISDQTKGKIPELYGEPLDSDTIIVLASSLYFKASWKGKFDLIPKGSPEARKYCFINTVDDIINNNCLDVQWMTKEGDMSYFPIKKGSKKIADVLEIPLKNKKKEKDGEDIHQFVMQIWAPENLISTTEEDREFQNVIKKNIVNIRKKMGRQLTLLTMPKFEIDYKEDIMEALIEMGIETVMGSDADLSPMLGNANNAYVSHVKHAVKLNVDENGVEGAAITTVGFGSRTVHTPTRIDIVKPFYFVISNRCWAENSGKGTPCQTSNVPLFMGRFVKP